MLTKNILWTVYSLQLIRSVAGDGSWRRDDGALYNGKCRLGEEFYKDGFNGRCTENNRIMITACKIGSEWHSTGERSELQGMLVECTEDGIVALSTQKYECSENRIFHDGNVIFSCEVGHLTFIGCSVFGNNKSDTVKIGDEVSVNGAYIYSCERVGSSAAFVRKYCLNFEGCRMYDGEIHFRPDGSGVECKSNEDGFLQRFSFSGEKALREFMERRRGKNWINNFGGQKTLHVTTKKMSETNGRCFFNGKVYKDGETFVTKDHSIFECASSKISKIGCQINENEKIPIGSKINVDEDIILCPASDGIIRVPTAGCRLGEKQLKLWEHASIDGILLACSLRYVKGTPSETYIRVVGCINENKDVLLADHWYPFSKEGDWGQTCSLCGSKFTKYQICKTSLSQYVENKSTKSRVTAHHKFGGESSEDMKTAIDFYQKASSKLNKMSVSKYLLTKEEEPLLKVPLKTLSTDISWKNESGHNKSPAGSFHSIKSSKSDEDFKNMHRAIQENPRFSLKNESNGEDIEKKLESTSRNEMPKENPSRARNNSSRV